MGIRSLTRMALVLMLAACSSGDDPQSRQLVAGLRCTAAESAGWCWQHPRPHGQSTRDAWFVDSMRGWIVGDAGLIMRTEDGGATWSDQTAMPRTDLALVRFVDRQRGWIAAANFPSRFSRSCTNRTAKKT